MKPSLLPVIIAALLPALFGSTCPTVDPPRPERLKSPVFTGYDILAGETLGEYLETIHLRWMPDSTDTISVTSYHILRKADCDCVTSIITNIPGDTMDLHEPTYRFIDTDDRLTDRLIYYRIFGVDSLERPGDTSAVYTVSLARLVNLLLPVSDTLQNEPINFRWQVPPIVNQIATVISLWKEDSTLWVSDTIKGFTGGGAPPFNRYLPASFIPLQAGEYYWGASLTIIGGSVTGDDATSIALRNFFIK